MSRPMIHESNPLRELPQDMAALARMARVQEIEDFQREASIVVEAARLTENLCEAHWLNQGVKHNAVEIAYIAIGYYKEIKAIREAQ